MPKMVENYRNQLRLTKCQMHCVHLLLTEDPVISNFQKCAIIQVRGWRNKLGESVCVGDLRMSNLAQRWRLVQG